MSIVWGSDDERQKPEALVIGLSDHPRWTEAECIDIFYRLLVRGWLEPEEMSVRTAGYYGTRLGHWGRLALEQQGHVIR